MRSLLIFTLVGVTAQLVDGALGMAFGVTASTLLVLSGVASAQASAVVHLAEVATTFTSGLSHWKFKNIDWHIVVKLGVPGAIGAFLGATVLSSLSTKDAAQVMAAILLGIGLYVLLRFSLRTPPAVTVGATKHSAKFLAPLGLFGGFIDASGGGGWGPVTTSTLISSGKTAPRTAIGSVSASEFLVAVSASLGFLVGLRETFFDNLLIVLALALGGVIAAPFAAWLVSRIRPALLGTAVGGVIVLTNSQKLVKYFGVESPWSTLIYTGIVGAWASFVYLAWKLSEAPALVPAEFEAEVDTGAVQEPTVNEAHGSRSEALVNAGAVQANAHIVQVAQERA